MRVKTFVSNSAFEIEEEVNRWLAANPGLRIEYVTQSMDTTVIPRKTTASSSRYILLTIFYELDPERAAAERILQRLGKLSRNPASRDDSQGTSPPH